MGNWFGEVDPKLKKGKDVMCPRCGKNVVKVDRVWGVLPCDQCNSTTSAFSTGGWTTEEKIKSRTYLPDGTVLTGRAGIRERDRRLKVQEQYERR